MRVDGACHLINARPELDRETRRGRIDTTCEGSWMRRASSRVSGSQSSEWHGAPKGRERGRGAKIVWRCLDAGGSESRRRSKFVRTAERPDDANSCTRPEEGFQRQSGSWLPW
jgi:hypothetical protein